jgi:hypothetical protein
MSDDAAAAAAASDATSAEPAAAAAPLATFKKRGNIRKKGARKKKKVASDSDSGEEGGVVKAAKSSNPNVHRLKRPRADEDGVDKLGVSYSADVSMAKMGRSAQDDATRTYEIDDPENMNVTNFRGPMRAPTNIRTTMRIDYQPDICKDYKDTGYCGYGDACKFMHDRGDYLAGWQMEKAWEAKQAAKKKTFEEGSLTAEADEVVAAAKKKEEELPWGCFICRGPFVDAMQTKCGHFFCERCALDRYNIQKQKGCFICLQPTLGIFNVAKELRMREKEERALAKQLAPALDNKSEWPVPTAFLLVKAEQKFGEPQGRTTMEKLTWIQKQLGQGVEKTKEQEAEEEAEGAKAAQQELEAQQSGWKSKRQGWVMGGSGLDAKYASGL